VQRQTRLVGKGDDALHKLSPAGMVFRPVVLINHQAANVSKLVFDLLPPLLNQVHNTIGGQFGADKEQVQLIQLRQKDALGSQRRCGSKIMV